MDTIIERAEIFEPDRQTLFEKELDAGAADATRSAGDDRDLAR